MNVYQVQFSTIDYDPRRYGADCWQAESWPFSTLEKATAFCQKRAGLVEPQKVAGVDANVWLVEYIHPYEKRIQAFRIWEMEVDRVW